MLNEIKLEAVSVDTAEKGFKIQAEWKAAWEIEVYEGPYQVELRLDGNKEQTYEAGSSTSYVFTLEEPKKQTGYSVVIKGKLDDGTWDESNEADLLFHTFLEVHGNFDGEMLHLFWKEDEDISYGSISLEDGSVTKTGFGRHAAHIPVHTELLNEYRASKIQMVPMFDSVSRGPGYTALFFIQKGKITSLEELGEKDGKIRIKLKLIHPLTDTKGLQAKLSLMSGLEELVSAYGALPASGDIWEFQLDKKGFLDRNTLKMLEMNLTLCSAQIDGSGNVPAEFVPLTEVCRMACRSNEKEAELTWDFQGSRRPTHYEVQVGNQTMRTADMALTAAFQDSFSLDAAVRPCYGGFIGRASEKIPLFVPGIFISGKESLTVGAGVYSPSEDENINLLFRQELFLTRPQEDICSDGFCLHKSGEGRPVYRLTVNRPGEKYEEEYRVFLKLLEEHQMTGEGSFLLTDALARLLPLGLDKLLYYACDFDGGGRSVGLRPGMALEVETGHYQPPYPDTKQYLPGYVASGRFRYEIGSRASKELWKTCFHPMLEGMKLSIRTYGQENNALEYQNGSGGILDLAADSASHQALYRLEYPVKLSDSQEVGSSYGPANACLYGYDKYTELREDAAHAKMAGAGSKLPAFYFRGRAAVTVSSHVFVNGQEYLAAVGTTLRQIMERLGIHSLENTDFHMERSVGAARLMRGDEVLEQAYLPLHLNFGETGPDCEQLPLLNGDRIWIGGENYAKA